MYSTAFIFLQLFLYHVTLAFASSFNDSRLLLYAGLENILHHRLNFQKHIYTRHIFFFEKNASLQKLN